MAKNLTIAEFFALKEGDRPKLLKTETVSIPTADKTNIKMAVRQLTKKEVDSFNRRILNTMPDVPVIEQVFTQARKDPQSGKIYPAGTYKEPNPGDPAYLRQTEMWLNDACLWLALYSSVDNLGVELDTDAFDNKFDEFAELFPPTSLISLAVAAASVNKGLYIADEILKQNIIAELDRRDLDAALESSTN